MRKAGSLIKLPPQPFKVLTLLVERAGELVTREDLQQQIWGNETFVDYEHGLNFAIKKIRDTLGDNPELPRFIETLPRRGYRFIAPVTTAMPPSSPRESTAVAPEAPVDSDALASRRRVRWVMPAVILLVGLPAILAFPPLYRLARRPVNAPAAMASTAPIQSLAILPLQNLSSDKDQEYFADGMTDELITQLGQIGALRVISRTSVMHYKGSSKTLPVIGRELNADAIVEGTVFRSGNRVRITAQLVDARTDRHLWAQEYERDLGDVLALQDDVALDITSQINANLAARQKSRVTAPRTVNPESLDAYLRGRYYWDQSNEEGFRKSFDYFQEAIEKDSSNALAYSGMADFYGAEYAHNLLSRNQACAKAVEAAAKSIRLDDSLAEAHNSMAAIRMLCD